MYVCALVAFHCDVIVIFCVAIHFLVFFCSICSGSGKLREWVALEGEANNAPRIRIAHHITNLQFEGTRKRRRAAMGDYHWSVGDRVDVWMQDW